MLGLILGLPNRSKNCTKNELILGPGARGAQGGRVTPGEGNGPVWEARGETPEGGTEAQNLRFQKHQTLSDLVA